MFESILCQVTEYDPDILESLIGLAVEIRSRGSRGRGGLARSLPSGMQDACPRNPGR